MNNRHYHHYRDSRRPAAEPASYCEGRRSSRRRLSRILQYERGSAPTALQPPIIRVFWHGICDWRKHICHRLAKTRLPYAVFCHAVLFSVVDSAGLANHVDFDLTWIFKLRFDMLGNVAGQQSHIVVFYVFRLGYDSDLTAGLDSK